MHESIVYIDTSEVQAGKLNELKAAMESLAQFVEANEPRIIAYNVYFTPDGTQMSVLHVHRDLASLEFHMKVAGPKFPSFAQFIKLLSIDIYGRPSDELLEQLQHKAQLLGAGKVLIHDLHAGFAHLASR